MLRIAMILNGKVSNIALWDGIKPWNPGQQYTLVDITSQPKVDIGWSYDGSVFLEPPAPIE